MRSSYDLKYNFTPALRAGAVALGLLALAAEAAPAAPPGEAATEAGAGLGPTSPRGEVRAQVGGSPSHALAAGADRIGERGGGGVGDILGGREAFAMQNSDVSAAFDALSRQQQARVIQRCKDVMARPAQADANQLAICQTLIALAK